VTASGCAAPHVGVFAESVGDVRPRDLREQRAHDCVVGAEHRQPVERQVVQELDEARLELLEIAAMRREVVRVDVRDDRDHRLQVHERCVALVGLGDQVLPRAETGVRRGALQTPADHERRVLATFGEHARDEARGRGLAVRARDGDRITEAHQLAEHLRALDDRHAACDRRGDLGVVLVDRARDDNHVGIGRVLGTVTGQHLRAERLQPARDVARLEIGALHRIAQVQ
jgi:hypothetical protein